MQNDESVQQEVFTAKPQLLYIIILYIITIHYLYTITHLQCSMIDISLDVTTVSQITNRLVQTSLTISILH